MILDVVYNHTAEGNHLGPTLCYRGIDNAAYYWLVPDTPRFYENFTGTGNALKLTHPRVLQMVMDSLRYWVEVFHVDGFRFDLATTLGRTPGFDPHSAFFAAIRQDPVLANVKLIAEPWDIGLGGYQVGGFPPGWSEWNDVYRKTLRRYWRGEGNLLGDLAARADRLGRRSSATTAAGRTPASITSPCMTASRSPISSATSTSTTRPTARTTATAPTTTTASIAASRGRPTIRPSWSGGGCCAATSWRSLLLAQGVPLILAGDEVGNSQDGNNNAYCQDNEIGWVEWSGLGTADDMTEFVGGLTRLRRRFPQLRLAALAGGQKRRWRARRAVAAARRRRDEGGGLEFRRRPLPRLRAGRDRGRRRAAVHRVQRRRERRRVHVAAMAECRRHGAACSTPQPIPCMADEQAASAPGTTLIASPASILVFAGKS